MKMDFSDVFHKLLAFGLLKLAIGKIAAHSAYDMFHGMGAWLLVCFFPTSVFGVGIFF